MAPSGSRASRAAISATNRIGVTVPGKLANASLISALIIALLPIERATPALFVR